VGDELWITGRAHFGDVEAGQLDFGGDAVAITMNWCTAISSPKTS
jgi:hypothetical protein